MATIRPGRDLVLDLGTSTLRLARVAAGKYTAGDGADGRRIIELPALTLVDRQRHSVVAVGNQAAIIARGTLPTGVEAVRPLRDGLVATFDPAVALVRNALHEAMGGERALRRLTRRPRALYSLPSTATDADRMIMHDVLHYAGLGADTPVPVALAAAVGAELPVKGSRPRVLCDLGAGLAEIAVLANGKVQVARSWPLGGDWLDHTIVRAVRRRRGLSITHAMAEASRRQFGALDEAYDYRSSNPPPPADEGEGDAEGETPRRAGARRRNANTQQVMAVVGAGGAFGDVGPNPHSRSNLPEFNARDVASGLGDGVRVLIEQIVWFWEDLEAGLRTALAADGLALTGGTAQLPGLAAAISRALGVPATLAADPCNATIRGLIELSNDAATWGTTWPWPPEWERGS